MTTRELLGYFFVGVALVPLAWLLLHHDGDKR